MIFIVNFIKYLRKLISIKENGSKKLDLEVLKDNIENENVTATNWFVKKIDMITTA